MKLLLWLLRGAIFIVLFGLGIKNSSSVDLRFFLDQHWQAPLSLVLLGAFTAGVIVGLAAMLGVWTRQRRELTRLHQQLTSGAKDHV